MHRAKDIKELNIGLQDAAQQLKKRESYVKCRKKM
jgi:hypothetical protein